MCPFVGSAIDFGLQLYQGEDATDAAIKTAGHMSAGMVGAAIGSVLPFAGTAIGFGIGIGVSMLFDWVYDNKESIAKHVHDIGRSAVDTVKDTGKK